MIALSALAEALAAHIHKKTGIPAYARRLSTAVYPMYSISLLPGETQLVAGGTQLLRRVEAKVACYPSRQRQEGESLDMADKLMQAVLPGFSLESRHFAPQNCTCREQEHILALAFTLEFCDLAAEEPGSKPAAEPMQTLSLLLHPKNET